MSRRRRAHRRQHQEPRRRARHCAKSGAGSVPRVGRPATGRSNTGRARDVRALEASVRARAATAAPVPPAQARSGGERSAQSRGRTPAISIAEESCAIDRARQALLDRARARALSELERYQARWPRGVFASEVLVLRVEAKLKLGDRASAVREARALIDARPNSRYAARLRALIENSK